MSMTQEPPDAEVIELEPTVALDMGGGDYLGAPVALVEGNAPSLTGETDVLRRRRLAAAALIMSIAYAALFGWNLATWADDLSKVWWLMAARFVLSAVVLGLVLSPVGRTARRVKILEVVLFAGIMILLFASQYFVSLALMRRDDVPGMVAFEKNGVIQTVILMMLFGTFIPNRPRTVALWVLVMMLTPLLAFSVLTEHPELGPALAQYESVEQTGANSLFLLIGALVAWFGSVVLNGLRTELHEARKFGQYQLVRQIGAGGMGEVHLAEHALLKRPCALKLIKPEAGSDPLALARFEREVQASARLAHHNTIAIYDYGHTDDGTFYYVMEYLRGMSLAELLGKHGPMPPGRVVYIFRQVCAGLAEAHGLGLVHRDLKPANIFVTLIGGEADVAKVLDFGLVKVTKEPEAEALTTDMTVSGTPLYMPPEQATGSKSLDPRADIYAIGAVMYHALAGQPPFDGEGPFAVMMAHARDAVVPPSEVRAEVPKDIEAVVLRCLAKKADDRYSSVRELSEALAGCGCASAWGPRQAEEWWASVGGIGIVGQTSQS